MCIRPFKVRPLGLQVEPSKWLGSYASRAIEDQEPYLWDAIETGMAIHSDNSQSQGRIGIQTVFRAVLRAQVL